MPTDWRFVFDTNVIVSALLLKQSVARQVFDKALEQGKLLVSQATVEELNEVLRRKGFDPYVLEDERIQFITALVLSSILLKEPFAWRSRTFATTLIQISACHTSTPTVLRRSK